MQSVKAVLASLYLRGAPHQALVRRRWPLVRDAIELFAPQLHDTAECLRDAGIWEEACVLDQPGVLDWGIEQVMSGRVLSVTDCRYPRRWLKVLGSGAPPVLWCDGEGFGSGVGESVSLAGSRSLQAFQKDQAYQAGRAIARAGRYLVTGGAFGADREAVKGFVKAACPERVALLLPYGLESDCPWRGKVTRLSLCEPSVGFTAAQAMERNGLIYAASPLSFVVAARYQEGGTWRGASDAIRRRLTRLSTVAAPTASEKGQQALVHLGMHVGPYTGRDRDGFEVLCLYLDQQLARHDESDQASLFCHSNVRERSCSYPAIV